MNKFNWDKYLRKDEISKIGDGENSILRIIEFRHLNPQSEGKRMLDVGASRLIDNELKDMGYDITPLSLIPENGIVGDMHNLPFDECSFDLVFSGHTIEHSISPYIALCEINRTLKDGGIAIIIFPEEGNFWTFLEHHYYCLTVRQIWSLLQKTGFEILKTTRFEFRINDLETCKELGIVAKKVNGWKHDFVSKEFTYFIPFECDKIYNTPHSSTQEILFMKNNDKNKSTFIR